jgi:hypothetical protein
MQTFDKEAGSSTSARVWIPKFLFVLTVFVSGTLPTRAQDSEGSSSSTELAKKTENPVADLISIPIENYSYFNVGTEHATYDAVSLKPVVPFHLNENWNLITRTIIPILNEPAAFRGEQSASGLGDINPSLFLSPANTRGFIWGAGPTFTLPTAANSAIGSGKFSMGPSAVVLTTSGPWLIGALAYNQWSVTGWGKNNVNDMLIEPFVNYNFGKGWHLSTAPLITCNWEAPNNNRWTVPVGGGIGKLVWLGKLPADFLVQAYSNVEHPKYTPDWELRCQVTLLLPGFK